MTQRVLAAAILALTLVLVPLANASAKTAYNASRWTGTAIEGIDPVAYFSHKKPVEGSRKFSVDWDGATWRFVPAQNRDLFKANPKKYAPQFGGWCAYAVSRGYTASIDPEAWSVVDGKLYLNYSLSVRDQWSEDVPGNIILGKKNWPGLKAELLN